jgi:hypothetical protein
MSQQTRQNRTTGTARGLFSPVPSAKSDVHLVFFVTYRIAHLLSRAFATVLAHLVPLRHFTSLVATEVGSLCPPQSIPEKPLLSVDLMSAILRCTAILYRSASHPCAHSCVQTTRLICSKESGSWWPTTRCAPQPACGDRSSHPHSTHMVGAVGPLIPTPPGG